MSSWKGKSIGPILGHKIFVWSLKYLGLSFCYFLLKPVTYFYFLKAKAPRKALEDFYQHLFQDKQSHRKLIRSNFYVFGQTLIDRVALGKGLSKKYHFDSKGRENIHQSFKSGEGCILISAHLGNWEIAGAILENDNLDVNVVLYDHENEQLKKYLSKQKTQKTVHVIPIKEDFSHLIAIKIALSKGQVVCIHGDRYIEGGRTIKGEFLGKEAHFPMGPFQLATKLKANYNFVFALKNSKFGYQLSCTETKKETSVDVILKEYIHALEKQVKNYPEQWFNFYNFFEKPRA
jgi:predicted LPLAT superfamily acyltransferase